MPTYDYKCYDCQHEWECILPISRRDSPTEEPCPKCNAKGNIGKIMLSAPAMGDPVRLGFTKPPGDVRDVLQKINERTAGSTLKSGSNLTQI